VGQSAGFEAWRVSGKSRESDQGSTGTPSAILALSGQIFVPPYAGA
jgi:hypothetical protein